MRTIQAVAVSALALGLAACGSDSKNDAGGTAGTGAQGGSGGAGANGGTGASGGSGAMGGSAGSGATGGGGTGATGGAGTGGTGGSAGTAGTGGTGGVSCGTATNAAYTFESKFDSGESSISYSGQVARHVLIQEIKLYIGGLDEAIGTGDFQPDMDGQVVEALNLRYLNTGDVYAGEALSLTAGDATLAETTLGDISSDKNLVGKTAGNDDSTDYKDWDDGASFVGWSDTALTAHGGDLSSPQGFITALFEQIEEAALNKVDGTEAMDPDGNTLPVHVTAGGWDLQQLTEKFLLMAVAFSQGADDYLDDDVMGKGLLASNTQSDTASYTSLEHAWDEGFGYFGATRDYDQYTDDEIAQAGGRPEYQGFHDTNADCAISFKSGEFLFGASVNAAKRDRGSVMATDYTKDAFDAFVAGRTLITGAGDTLTTMELDTLRGHRDAAVSAWEKAIAATVIHYINDTLQDMNDFGTTDYSFTDHAKHWSEMKGFALGLQFNPSSPLNSEFVNVHTLLGDRPVLANATTTDIDNYKQALIDARTAMGQAYGFPTENLGDNNGEGGW